MAPASDRVGRIETHGIDYVPDTERHGTARSLFVVWAASNVTCRTSRPSSTSVPPSTMYR
jgi:purine-cytosine permease-like protein